MGIQRGRKWDIPTVIDPPGERCITLRIPDNDEWENMLYSAIYNELGMWIAYARDEGKNGTKIATRWREALRTWRDDFCPVEPEKGGEEIEEMSNFRIDCECNVYVRCCDGTEKQILTSDQVKALILGQPGSGGEQPKPGGGQACYPMIMPANQQRLVPTLVSAGDQLAIQSPAGITSNSHTALWHDAAGNWIFGGVNLGLPEFNAGNPVPAAPTGSIIVNFGAGWLALGTGTITVPGGVSNAQPVLQINDSTITGDSGELQFQVCVTNNQAAPWIVTDDFTHSPFAWFPVAFDGGCLLGTWVAGVGWVNADCNAGGTPVRGATVENDQPMTFLGSVDVAFDITKGYYAGGGTAPAFGVIVNGTTVYSQDNASTTDGTHTIHVPVNTGSITSLRIFVQTDEGGGGSFSGSCTISQIVMRGSGANKPT